MVGQPGVRHNEHADGRRALNRVLVPAFGYLVLVLGFALLLDSPLIETGPRSNLERALADLGPVEWGQWALYGLTALTAAALYGRLHRPEERRERTFWGLMALFFIWCLIEDAGNQRWTLGGYARLLFGGFAHDWTSVVYMLLLGGFGAGTLWFYRDVALASRASRPYLYAGVGLFAVAAFLLEVVLRLLTALYFPEASLVHAPLIGELDADDLEELFEFAGAACMLAAFYTHRLEVELGTGAGRPLGHSAGES